MVATRYTQSLSDFRQKASETFDRLKQTGAAEVITVDGEEQAVLLSPAAYSELMGEAQIAHDVEVMRQAIAEGQQGKGQEVGAFFAEMRAKLLAMKAAQEKGSAQ